jgi:hypothetical protein
MHKWENLARQRVGEEKLSRLRVQARAEVAIEMNLPELREPPGKTQISA